MRQVSRVDVAGQAVINRQNLFLIPFAYKWKTMHGKIPAAEFEDHIYQSLSQHNAWHGSIVTQGPQQLRAGRPHAVARRVSTGGNMLGSAAGDISSTVGALGHTPSNLPGEAGDMQDTPARPE